MVTLFYVEKHTMWAQYKLCLNQIFDTGPLYKTGAEDEVTIMILPLTSLREKNGLLLEMIFFLFQISCETKKVLCGGDSPHARTESLFSKA